VPDERTYVVAPIAGNMAALRRHAGEWVGRQTDVDQP